MAPLQRSLEGGTDVKVTFAYKIRSEVFNASLLEEPHKPSPPPTSPGVGLNDWPVLSLECAFLPSLRVQRGEIASTF